MWWSITEVGTVTGDETAVGAIIVLTTDVIITGEVNIDRATLSGAKIDGVAKGETKEDEATTVGGIDSAVIFSDKSSKMTRAWLWAIASVWVLFWIRFKLCVWARASVWTLARV